MINKNFAYFFLKHKLRVLIKSEALQINNFNKNICFWRNCDIIVQTFWLELTFKLICIVLLSFVCNNYKYYIILGYHVLYSYI